MCTIKKIEVEAENFELTKPGNFQKCSGCGICELACSIFHEGEANPELSRIEVIKDLFEGTYFQKVCRQCPIPPPCILACPSDGAITRDEETGAIIINEAECVGCMKCKDRCPESIPRRHPEKDVSIICDLCHDREKGPACVEFCSWGVLELKKIGDQ